MAAVASHTFYDLARTCLSNRETEIEMSEVKLITTFTPIAVPWVEESTPGTFGADLEKVILDRAKVYLGKGNASNPSADVLDVTFTEKEHGDFFDGVAAMARTHKAITFANMLHQYKKMRVVIKKEYK